MRDLREVMFAVRQRIAAEYRSKGVAARHRWKDQTKQIVDENMVWLDDHFTDIVVARGKCQTLEVGAFKGSKTASNISQSFILNPGDDRGTRILRSFINAAICAIYEILDQFRILNLAYSSVFPKLPDHLEECRSKLRDFRNALAHNDQTVGKDFINHQAIFKLIHKDIDYVIFVYRKFKEEWDSGTMVRS